MAGWHWFSAFSTRQNYQECLSEPRSAPEFPIVQGGSRAQEFVFLVYEMLLAQGSPLRTTGLPSDRHAALADIEVGVVVDVTRGPWAVYTPGGRGPCSGGEDPDPGA